LSLFPETRAVVRNLDKLKCAQRELALRERVYPRRVASGMLTQEKADREIAVMEAIVADYVRLVAAEGG
jgi:hypothetical protein